VCRTINSPALPYGYETWSLRLREENRFEGVHQHAAEENILTKKEWKLEKTEQLGDSGF
jgi:hypothetical protein